MSGCVERVGAGEDDLALAVRLHRVGEHDHALGVGAEADVRVVEVLVRVDPKAAAPDVGVVAADEEPDLRVVGVLVAQPGREPGARVVERRRHEAVSGRRPFGDAALGLLLERLQLRGQVRVVGRVGRQRSRRARAARPAPSRCRPRSSRRRPPAPGTRARAEDGPSRCLPTSGASSRHGTPTRFELVLRSDAGEQEDLR